MRPRTLILTFVAFAGIPLGTVVGDEGSPQPKRSVLIVDGMNNHDWERATRIIKAILTDSGLFTVDVSTSPPADAPAERWRDVEARLRPVRRGGHELQRRAHVQGRPLAP